MGHAKTCPLRILAAGDGLHNRVASQRLQREHLQREPSDLRVDTPAWSLPWSVSVLRGSLYERPPRRQRHELHLAHLHDQGAAQSAGLLLDPACG